MINRTEEIHKLQEENNRVSLKYEMRQCKYRQFQGQINKVTQEIINLQNITNLTYMVDFRYI